MSLTKGPQKYIRNCSWVRAPEDGDPKPESLGEKEGGIGGREEGQEGGQEEGQGGGPGRREQEEKCVGGPGEDPLHPLWDPKASEMGVEDTGSLETGAFIFILGALG